MTDGAITFRPLLDRPDVAEALALLNADGEEARIVGGAVRNHLMGLPISDIDIATTAVPDVVLERARAAGLHAVPTGYEHGTVTLVVRGLPHEVTTLREDIHTDGRRAVVCFGRDFRADAFRRDFTINALSVGPDGVVRDYGGGLDDIAARRVRFIGDADQRIREDYLRILRFFRFSAAYGAGTLEAEGLAAAIRNRDGLALLSRERVRQETMKLLVAPQAVAVVAAMAGHGFLEAVLGGAGDAARLARLAALEGDAGLPASPVRRLLALGIESAADIERLRERLRLTNAEQKQMERLLAVRGGWGAGHRAMLYRLGPDLYRDAVLDGAAGGAVTDWRAALALPDVWTVPAFRLSGRDVLALGVARGPEVSRILATTEAAWIAAGMPEGEAAQRDLLAASLNPAP